MKLRNGFLGITMVALSAGACNGDDTSEEDGEANPSERGGIGTSEQALVPGPLTIDPRRSLAVTETAILAAFSLRDVMNQLAAQSGVPGLTGALMFKQLWDTQNPKPGLTAGPHCDDVLVGGQPSSNGFPYSCRPAEGAQAQNPEFEVDNYKAIGLFNRFDLAPASGVDCGEHRVVFARTPAGIARSFLIFEAVLANPQPQLGLEGCRPVATFWRSLSSNNDVASRATALRGFYFNGIFGFSPVVHVENYGVLGPGRTTTGQVRTNQFLQQPWMLRELKLQKACGASGSCSFLWTPVADKTNPFGALFAAGAPQPLAAEFQSTFFPSQVASLAVANVNLFDYKVPAKYNAGESAAQAPTQNNYLAAFDPASPFATGIQAKLTQAGSSLTPTQIVARAQALSCAGCHQLSNNQSLGGGITWPSSLGFVHVSEQATESGPDGPRFVVSSALQNVFLPRRKVVFEDFLNRPAPPNDYTGDRKAEIVVFRPSDRTMNVLRSVGGWQGAFSRTVGQVGDRGLPPADHDGDGVADMAVWRPPTGLWTIKGSLTAWTTPMVRTLGAPGDIPITGADLDGDRKAEIIVFRPSSGTWTALLSSTAWTTTKQTVFGSATDVPLTPADYDGDRKADLVFYRPGNATFSVLTSSSNGVNVVTRTVGSIGDLPVPGADHDGDGQADMAVWRQTDGRWTLKTSSGNWQTSTTVFFGVPADAPLAGADFDGDAKADLALFRASTRTWRVRLSSSGGSSVLVRVFGVTGDIPLTR